MEVEEENEGGSGLLARMSKVFNEAMDGLDLMEANASVVQRTKRRVIDSMIQEQVKAFQELQASNFSFDDFGESSEEEEEVSEEDAGEDGEWMNEEKGEELAMQAGGKEKRGEGGGWSLPSARDCGGQSKTRKSLGVTRRRTREGHAVEDCSGDEDEADGESMIGRLEGSGEDDDEETDVGSESVSSGEVNRRMELRKGIHAGIDDDDDDDDDEDDDDDDDGQEVVVGLDGTITKVPPGQRKQDKQEKGTDVDDVFLNDDDDDDDDGKKESDASSEFERSLYEAEAFKEGVVPREVQRLERRVRRAEREAEREQKLKRQEKDARVAGHEEKEEEEEEKEEEFDIDEELRRENPREILRSLTGSQKSENEEVMSFDERIAQPMSDIEVCGKAALFSFRFIPLSCLVLSCLPFPSLLY